MKSTLSWLVCFVLLFPGAGLVGGQTQNQEKPKAPSGPERWEKEVKALEAKDQEKAPPKGGVVFAGSSSIRLWDLNATFPGLPVVNRGFGGSQIADSTHYAPRLLIPLKPRVLVLYAGDNDLAAGKTVAQVTTDFQAFVKTVHGGSPKTRIVFLAIKPSPVRTKFLDSQRQANDRIKAMCEGTPGLRFVDVATPLLGPDGQPRVEFFRKDNLHLNEKGYAVWTPLVRQALE